MNEFLIWSAPFMAAFVPLFVAIDAPGMVGVYVGLTSSFPESRKARLVATATLTALVISVLFLFFGKLVFKLLAITESDFRVGGGIVLLILAIMDLLFSHHEKRRAPEEGEDISIVPIGIPLIMGPAALTTILITVDTVGWRWTLVSIVLNLAITWAVFRYSSIIVKLMGKAGTRAIAKVMNLFLAAIAVMMIRKGIMGMIETSTAWSWPIWG